MIKLFTDAATNGQPGQAGIGIVIAGENIYKQLAVGLDKIMSIHEAEWEAFIFGLKYLQSQNLTEQLVICYTDSQLIAQSIEKNFVKNKLFRPYLDDFHSLAASFSIIHVEWIPSSQNKGADNLAKQGLQKAIRQHRKNHRLLS